MLASQSVADAAVRFIDALPAREQALPSALIIAAGSLEERRAKLRQLVAGVLGRDPGQVEIEHAPERPPVVASPPGSGLHLSSASRGAVAVLGVSAAPIGVDVEAADEAGEIPWNALHRDEAAMLRALHGQPQAMALARLWSLKESYLKALGLGLGREPASFAVRFRDGELAQIDDPVAQVPVGDARTTWRSVGKVRSAVSAVVLVPR